MSENALHHSVDQLFTVKSKCEKDNSHTILYYNELNQA